MNHAVIHMKLNGLYIHKGKRMKLILKLPELSDRSHNKCGQTEARKNPCGENLQKIGVGTMVGAHEVRSLSYEALQKVKQTI